MSKQNEPPLGVGGSGPVLWFIGAVVLFLVLQTLMGCIPQSQVMPATRVAGPAPTPWVVVGDSVVNSAREPLRAAAPAGSAIYGEIASGPYTTNHVGYVPLIDRVRQHTGAPILVVQDDARDQSAAQYLAFMKDVRATAPGACIVWVTPWAAMSRAHDDMIRKVIETNVGARERIAPWGSMNESGGALTTDTVHVSAHGGRVFTQLIKEAVASC